MSNGVVEITINGDVLSNSTILTNIQVSKSEGQNSLATISLKISPSEIINKAAQYEGKSITIQYYKDNTSYRLFTGFVENPVIDLEWGIITLNCSQRRDELIRSKYNQFSYNLGRYSEAVQGTALDVSEETELRMQSLTSSLDFDSYNTPNITSWYAKATADYEFTNSDVRRKDIKIDWQQRSNIVNKYQITINYSFTRLYHWQRSFSWVPPYADNLADYLAWDYDLPNVQIIKDAVETNSWRKMGNISFLSVWAEQQVTVVNPYTYPPANLHEQYTTKWMPTIQQGQADYVYDETGTKIKDINGNDRYTFRRFGTQQDLEAIVCRTATWNMAARFGQDVQEEYTLTLNATQSQDKYGAKIREKTVSVTAEFDTNNWETFDYNSAAPAGAEVQGSSFYFNQKYNIADFNNAVATALDVCNAEIVNSHRGTNVTFATSLKPLLEIRHTVELTTAVINCKARVVGITHVLNPGSGDFTTTCTLAVMRADGSATQSAFVIPAAPTDGLVIPSSTINLGSTYGLDPATTDGSDAWNGHVGNKAIYGAVPFFRSFIKTGRTEFTQEFRVDTPAVPDAMRQRRDLATTATYTIALTNDDLTN